MSRYDAPFAYAGPDGKQVAKRSIHAGRMRNAFARSASRKGARRPRRRAIRSHLSNILCSKSEKCLRPPPADLGCTRFAAHFGMGLSLGRSKIQRAGMADGIISPRPQ